MLHSQPELRGVCSVLDGWGAVDTTRAPLTLRGIDSAQLSLMQQAGGQAVELASLRDASVRQKVLQHPDLVRHVATPLELLGSPVC